MSVTDYGLPDSSFLISLYLADANTAQASKWMIKNTVPVSLTEFSRLEFINTLRSLVARGQLSSTTLVQILLKLEEDIRDEILIKRRLNLTKVVHTAENLSARYAEKQGIRCIDLLHVASALLLKSTLFLTFDQQQASFAKKAGLKVKP